MDNEKKYNEALERAKEIKEKIMYSHLSTESCKAVAEYIDTIIPELRESEDERIRKEIIEYLKLVDKGEGDYAHPMVSGWIAWLEKQKVNTEGDFGRGYDCGYQAGYAVAMHEMKPKVATATVATATFDSPIMTSEMLQGKLEQKPAEEISFTPVDTELTEFEKAVVKLCQIGKDEYPCYEFAKKYAPFLLDIAKKELVKPAEWSEEDEANFKWFDKFFRAESVIANGRDIPQDKYLWFKSLRPQPRISDVCYGAKGDPDPAGVWKPSEEQMAWLKLAVEEANEPLKSQLAELYKDIRENLIWK